MKTALNELLDYLHLDDNYEEINENLQIHDIVYKVDSLLKKEKEQIINAYKVGKIEATQLSTLKSTAEEYYTETYK